MTLSRIRRPALLATLVALLAMGLVTAPNFRPAVAAKGGKPDSGGRAIVHKAGAKKVKSKALARKAPVYKTFRLNHGAGEPTIAVNKKGTAFFPAAEIALRNTVDVMRSKDGGRTWQNKSPQVGGQNSHPTTLDPYVWIDEDTSRIYTIDLTVACSILSWTDNEGESWTTNPLACGVPVNDHQTLFGGPAATSPTVGYENLLYYCWNNVASSYCSKSIDGGITFTATGEPAYQGASQGQGFCGGLHGHGVVSNTGVVMLPREYCNQAYLAISKDEGRTWNQVKVAKMRTSGGSDTSVAVDSVGNIYYLFVGGDDGLPYLVVSKNNGKSWTKPKMVGPPGLREANLPTIDAGGKGKIAIAYMGSENVKIKREGDQESRDYAAATWNGYMTTSTTAHKKSPIFFTGTINSKKDPIYRQKCGPGRCGAVFDFIDVEITPKGDAWSSWVDACVTFCAKGGVGNDGDEGVVGRMIGGPNLK